MEPTATARDRLSGNLNARSAEAVRAAHVLARETRSLGAGALAPRRAPGGDVEIEGLTYREVVSVTRIGGGVAGNVVPDAVTAWVNLRYAPTRSPEEAAELRELVGSGGCLGNARPDWCPQPARPTSPGGTEVAPKQAWTPVAEFAAAGVDAVNFGPGDPGYAHRDDERVEVASLVRSSDVLRAFLAPEEGA
jgi:succinyl-diaminopimelate desuccinylase